MYRRKSVDPSRTLGRREAKKATKLNQIYKEGDYRPAIMISYLTVFMIALVMYNIVHETILVYQSHTLGLFPRGQSQHARVRDNVYCAMALWAVSLAYRYAHVNKTGIIDN